MFSSSNEKVVLYSQHLSSLGALISPCVLCSAILAAGCKAFGGSRRAALRWECLVHGGKRWWAATSSAASEAFRRRPFEPCEVTKLYNWVGAIPCSQNWAFICFKSNVVVIWSSLFIPFSFFQLIFSIIKGLSGDGESIVYPTFWVDKIFCE